MIGTLSEFQDYATARGVTSPALQDATLATAALVRASDYITYSYVRRFAEGYDETSPLVEEATYEAAIIELATPNFFNKTYTPGLDKVLVQVDTIRWQVVGDVKQGLVQPISTRIEQMLSPYLKPFIGMLLA